ncbi:TetR/AcrR family transcriptional regulator [Flavobacterium salilacus subsp. salilacus]|uniref:TetR/AcrR family transcriptional regulator n=1 Tax=Flavobacterium TaxID=237 RepID=UPI001074F6CE|nr:MULTISPECIES: TetR/AcrR family transcriptional regulator [Flavobacterium]KAF2520158.1 TetR/AcrR family transcriptional regulator [Flavobacterium salilacus subsp. salilacus]MBE1613925.1 TetR/AcrR family transcriptional regulator [Flavobacterium sp. SaA2.13]NDI97965.1 TetR/AcrR family transcriptional regulator [Flavobacterium salilacus subsp. altitudinum]
MRETIVKKATEMFMSFGFKSVTMDDIANELGISKKTIYQHFCNKHDLVEASTLSVFETVSCGIDGIREMGKNSIEEIFIIRSFMMQHLNNESASPFYQLQKFFPKIFSCLRAKQFEKMNGCMKENLQKGIDNGLYRDTINVDFISRIYFTGLTGIKDQDIFPATMFNVTDLTKQFLEYHLRGIVTAKGQAILEKLLETDKIKLT